MIIRNRISGFGLRLFRFMWYKWGKDSALTAISCFSIGMNIKIKKWINALELTPIGMERQATKYARYVLDDYAETREHP